MELNHHKDMRNLCLILVILVAGIIQAFGQGSSCSDATDATSIANYTGTVPTSSSQYWVLTPSSSGIVKVSITSPTECGTVVDIKQFSSSQTGTCVPGGAGSEGRIVTAGGACGSIPSCIDLSVTAGQVYYLKVSGYFLWEDYTLTIGSCTPIIGGGMPVTNFHLTGVAKEGWNALSWSTDTETSNSHFVIERSDNGTEFTEIGRVEGSGNSNSRKEYIFDDFDHHVKTTYYRISQVDQTGSSSYSNAIAITNERFTSSFLVFPNPSTEGSFNIELNKPVKRNTRGAIYNVFGQEVSSFNVSEGTRSIPVQYNLSAGNYVIQMILSEELIRTKFTVK